MILLAQLLFRKEEQGESLEMGSMRIQKRDLKIIATRVTFLASTLVSLNPSPNNIISAIIALSGTIMAIGRNIAFKLSGSSVRPAYPVKKYKFSSFFGSVY